MDQNIRLNVRNVGKVYHGDGGEVSALMDVSFSVPAGAFQVVRGPSGSGKSTLLLICGGLLQPAAGQVLVEGEDLYAMSAEQRARFRATRIGFVFQQFHLIPYLSVLENVMAASLARSSDRPSDRPHGHARERARELLCRFALEPRLDHRPSQLSTGERQRVAMARAMMNRPRLLLADEPTGNLDHENARIVMKDLADFAAEGGAVLMVTHGAHADHPFDNTIQLRDGCVASVDPTAYP